jgi:HEAT repeat protein
MNAFLLLLTLALGRPQSSPEALIEQLSSPEINVRAKATAELLAQGTLAVPSLKLAANGADAETSMRAKDILQRIETRQLLSPALRAIAGLDLRLIQGGNAEWTAVFLEAQPWKAAPSSPYESLGRDDLECLVARAITGAREESVLLQVLGAAQYYKLDWGRAKAEQLLADPRPAVRKAAVQVLVAGAGTKLADRIGPLLQGKDADLRLAAIDALGRSNNRAAVPLLLALKDDDSMAFPLGNALLWLHCNEGTNLVAKTVRPRAPGIPGGNSRGTMVLGFFGGPEIIPLMRTQLDWIKDDPNTADGALNYLGNWGDRESIPLIEAAVKGCRVWGNTPRSITRALYHMGATSSTATLLKLADEGAGSALDTIGLMGCRDAVPELRKFMATGRADAVTALATLRDRESIPAIRALLKNSDERMRGAACWALAVLDDVESLEQIREMKEADDIRKIWPRLGSPIHPDGAALPTKVARNTPYGDSEFAWAISEGTNTSHGFPRYLSARAAATVRAGRTVEELKPWMGKEGDEYHGLIASAALARMGRREGAPALLEAERLLFALNGIRAPETLKLLESKTTSLDLYAPYEKIHRALAAEAGLALEGPPADSDAHVAWTQMHQRYWKLGRPATIAEAFEMLEDDRWSIVLENDRIRVVPQDAALKFWSDWFEGK